MMKSFNNAATDMRGGWQPSLSLELALAEVLDAPSESMPSRSVSSPPSTTVHAQSQPSEPVHPVSAPPLEDKSAPSSKSEPPTVHYQEADAPKEEADSAANDEVHAPRSAQKPVISAADVIKEWNQLASSLPKSQANLSALLKSVKMIDVQGKTLILGLASDVLVSKIDKPDQIEVIRRLIEDRFGVDLNIRCVVTTAKGKIPPNISQDGMVAAAIQQGGQIVDM